jgi:hypothetical protein
LGKILDTVSKEDANLLVRTLVESGWVCTERIMLTIYPGGVPADRVGASDKLLLKLSSLMDKALFQKMLNITS